MVVTYLSRVAGEARTGVFIKKRDRISHKPETNKKCLPH